METISFPHINNLYFKVGLVEIVLESQWDGPKTIGRYNTIGLEDGAEKVIDCLMAQFETYFEHEDVMSYVEFLAKITQEYNALH